MTIDLFPLELFLWMIGIAFITWIILSIALLLKLKKRRFK